MSVNRAEIDPGRSLSEYYMHHYQRCEGIRSGECDIIDATEEELSVSEKSDLLELGFNEKADLVGHKLA
jgi:hypothetical protein